MYEDNKISPKKGVNGSGTSKNVMAAMGNTPTAGGNHSTIVQSRTGISETVESDPPKKRTKRQEVESFLTKNYEFRYNCVTGAIEWKEKGKCNFSELDDRQLGTLSRRIDKEYGVDIDSGKLNRWLDSDFVPSYHPITTYFDSLKDEPVAPSSPIAAFARTVKTAQDAANPDLFEIALRRWLVASIANTYNSEGCQNQTCLVLTGDQGAFKTTLLNLLIPLLLLQYLYCGRIDLGSKDTYVLLSSQFIINLDDQLRELNKKDAETVKTLISHGNVTVRLPYQMKVSRRPRLASFVASINGAEFLSDPTGSRRFLPFEAISIDIEAAKSIDINTVWAEAYRLYNEGFQYWFTAQETRDLFGGNQSFQIQTPEYELLMEHFEPVEVNDINAQRMTTTQIIEQLQPLTKIVLTPKQIGAALVKMGFKKITTRRGNDTVKKYIVRTPVVRQVIE